MKREEMPRFWPIPKKEHVWAIRTGPGPHPLGSSFPLLLIVRDILGHAETGKEAKALIKLGKMIVDGRPRRSERHPVGVMDVVELPDAEQAYRVLTKPGGGLKLVPIGAEEATFKLVRIVGKTTLRGGRTQLNLHDGRCIVPAEGGERYGVDDVLRIKVPEQEVLDHIRFEEGVRALVTGGASQGRHGVLVGIGAEPGPRRTVAIRTDDGEEIRTLARYVFAVGSGEPLIRLAGG